MYFTALNMRRAYNLIHIKEGKEQRIVFRTCYSYFQYIVMLFRLTNALAVYQALTNNMLRAHLDITVVVYLNNILVYSKTLEEHKIYMQQVLDYLATADLCLKLEKCKQHKEDVEFLSYIIGRNRVKISSIKI